MAVESLFFGRNVTTALTVGQARGVLLLAAAQAGLPIYEYKPAEVKQALAGYGAADKRQMQEMVRILLDLDDIPRPDDAADAVAVAICHLHSARLQRLMDEHRTSVRDVCTIAHVVDVTRFLNVSVTCPTFSTLPH